MKRYLPLILFAVLASAQDNPPLSILTNGFPPAFQGKPYNAVIYATGGVRPYTFTITSGKLPSGLVMNNVTRWNSGRQAWTTYAVINGTPLSLGQFQFVVAVTDSSSNRAQLRISSSPGK